MRPLLYIILPLLFFSCRINREKAGVPVGKWRYVSGSENNMTVVNSRYDRKGREKGIWKYYVNDTLFRVEKYYYPYSVTILYNRNGTISEVGKSFTTSSSWSKYGTWYKFSEKGVLSDSVRYDENE